MGVLEKLEQRTLALTSHLWWEVDKYMYQTPINENNVLANFKEEINSILNKDSNVSIGVEKIMLKFADIDIAKYYLANNVKMGGNFLTVSLYNYGYMNLIFITIFMAILYVIIIKNFISSIVRRDIIGMILMYRLLIFYEAYLWTSGTVTDFFSIENLIIFILYKIWMYLPRKVY